MSQSRHGPNNRIVTDSSTKQKWQPMPRYGTPRRVCCKQLHAASESCFRFRKGPSFVCCSSCPTLRQAAGLCPPSRSSVAPWSGPRRNVARITSKSRWNASDFDLKHHHKPATIYNYMVSIEIMSGINLSIRIIRKKKRHCVVCFWNGGSTLGFLGFQPEHLDFWSESARGCPGNQKEGAMESK